MLHVELNHILPESDALQMMVQIISEVETTGESYVLTKDGRPVVAIVNVTDLEEELGETPVAAPATTIPAPVQPAPVVMPEPVAPVMATPAPVAAPAVVAQPVYEAPVMPAQPESPMYSAEMQALPEMPLQQPTAEQPVAEQPQFAYPASSPLSEPLNEGELPPLMPQTPVQQAPVAEAAPEQSAPQFNTLPDLSAFAPADDTSGSPLS